MYPIQSRNFDFSETLGSDSALRVGKKLEKGDERAQLESRGHRTIAGKSKVRDETKIKSN